MTTKQLTVLFACIILAVACNKEPITPEVPVVEDPVVENPIDTTTVINPPDVTVDTTTYLPASAFMAEHGDYKAIRTTATNNGLQYSTDDFELRLLGDTLRLGTMKLVPISSGEAIILPFVTLIQKTTSNGYSYNVEGRGSGTVGLVDGNLQVNLQKVALDSTSSSSTLTTYYNCIPSALPLNRDSYLGQYWGYANGYSGFGTSITITIEPLEGTTDGVWLKEIKRNAYVAADGSLVIPESEADPALYGTGYSINHAYAKLTGKLLQFSQIFMFGLTPNGTNSKSYTLIKQ